jgi:hypothetical protein
VSSVIVPVRLPPAAALEVDPEEEADEEDEDEDEPPHAASRAGSELAAARPPAPRASAALRVIRGTSRSSKRLM